MWCSALRYQEEVKSLKDSDWQLFLPNHFDPSGSATSNHLCMGEKWADLSLMLIPLSHLHGDRVEAWQWNTGSSPVQGRVEAWQWIQVHLQCRVTVGLSSRQGSYLEIKKQMDKLDPLAHPLLQWLVHLTAFITHTHTLSLSLSLSLCVCIYACISPTWWQQNM